jgi:hypothetical protein
MRVTRILTIGLVASSLIFFTNQTTSEVLPAGEDGRDGAPPAIAAAVVILQIANGIKELFSSSDDVKKTQEQILAKLDHMQKTLDEVNGKLDTIINRFSELEFHIDQQFEYQRVVDVLAQIRQIDQHYASWTDPSYKPGIDPGVPDPSVILQQLRNTSTALRQYPSYVNYSTVALAMAYERLILVKVLHVPTTSADMQRGFAQYADYYRNAAANAEGKTVTVGLRWSQINVTWNGMQQSFVALPRPLRCAQGRGICCENPTNWWYVGRSIFRYDGDLLTGFRLVAKETDLTAGPGGWAALACRNSEHPMYPRQSGCPVDVGHIAATSCDLDQRHATAVTTKQALDDLAAALDSLKEFNAEAEKWAKVPISKRFFPDPRNPPQINVKLRNALAVNPNLRPPSE